MQVESESNIFNENNQKIAKFQKEYNFQKKRTNKSTKFNVMVISHKGRKNLKYCDRKLISKKVEEIIKSNPVIKDEFDIIRKIGQGAFGVVFLGEAKKFKNKKVAIKIIIKKLKDVIRKKGNNNMNKSLENKVNEKGMEVEKNENNNNNKDNENVPVKKLKINEETLFLRNLKCQNIIGLFGFYESENHSCIVSEYAGLGDISFFKKNLIKREVLSETLICFIARQVLSAICYLSKCRVLHRDIKPQNILVTDKLEFKLSDFSISQNYPLSGKEFKLNSSGTAFFSPPEVLNREEISVDLCERIDLFGLGATIYKLTTGNYIFGMEADSYQGEELRKYQLNKINSGKIEFNEAEKKNYSPYFIDFVMGLLEKNINNRMSVKEAMEHIWIKKSEIIIEEKEKIVDLEKFLIKMMMNDILEFNQFRKSEVQDGQLKYYKK